MAGIGKSVVGGATETVDPTSHSEQRYRTGIIQLHIAV